MTLSGPVLTYGLAYLGMILLRSPRARLFAYALIFASFSHLRFIQNLTGRGDELVLAEQGFGVTSQAAVAAVVFLIGLPPVIAAYRVIANRRRAAVFLGSWLLPLPVLALLLFGNHFLFETSEIGWRLGSFLGVSRVVLLANVAAVVVFLLLGPRYMHPQGEAEAYRE